MGRGNNNDLSRKPYQASRSYGQDKIVDWLASESRLEQVNYQPLSDFNLKKVEGFQWPEARFTKESRDGDLQSTVSVDDTLSHSGSSHESLISDSSSQTSSSSATDPFDFLDDSDRDSQISSKANCSGSKPSQSEIESKDFFLQSSGFLGASTSSVRHDRSRTRHVKVEGPSTFAAERSIEQSTGHTSSVDQSNKHAHAGIPRNTNARRSSCSSKTNGQPCKLKRDTECTDQFVSLLIVFATRLITAIWPLSACPPMMSACFNGAGVLPLQVFIQETLKRSRTSYSTLQIALYYLVLLRARLPAKEFCHEQGSGSPDRKQCRAMQCGRRMFLSALMLASKYLQDRNYSARAWSKISGLRSVEINENEREYLSLIDYSLHVPKDVFDNWNKIVIALSKLSKEEPQCRMDLSDSDSPFDHSDDGAYNGPSDSAPYDTFSDEWWSDMVSKLNVETIKDASMTEDFLAAQVPLYRDSSSASSTATGLGRCEASSVGMDLLPVFMDINFSESLKPRQDQSRSSSLQPTTQTSPVRALTIPMQPRLRNLPTPQTTPKIADGHHDQIASNARPLRCSASMDALRNMRRQCLMNANLDRCPPPRRQVCEPSTSSSLNLPAEMVQKSPDRMATPSIPSPASATSDSTSYTSRSRSSSISSVSSCSSYASNLPRPRVNDACQSSSPLAARSCLPNRGSTNLSKVRIPDISGIRFVDEGYGSGEDPPSKFFKQSVTSSEETAVEILMSLSVQSENQSQCVTPTPQNYDVRDEEAMITAQRGHKRSLSKTEPQLHSHVRTLLWDHPTRGDVVEDSLRPSTATPKQWQCPSKTWAEPKRALPNSSDTKRVAYCALAQYASAPELALQYLQDVRISATS